MKKIDLKKTEAVEYEIELEQGSNKISALFAYTDDFREWVSRVPKFGTQHPDHPALKLKKFKGSREPGEIIKVTLNFEANNPEASYPGRPPGKIKRYGCEPTNSEEPLLTFHKLSDLDDQSREAIGQLLASSRTKEDFATATSAIGSDPLAIFAMEKIRKGREAYLNHGMMWVERSTTSTLADLELSKFLKIDNPPGNPPALPDGANWLYVAGPASPNEDGETWELERRWLASARGGWDDWFYG